MIREKAFLKVIYLSISFLEEIFESRFTLYAHYDFFPINSSIYLAQHL